jgi:isoquinoline 1-oxidoreductase beta subunit
MSPSFDISRREFLRVSTGAGVGLFIGIYLPGCQRSPTPTSEPTTIPESAATLKPTATPEPEPVPESKAPAEPTDWLEPNIYLHIDNNGIVTITAFRSELGQGVRTAIAMIVAEELDVDWSAVRIEQAGADRAYGDQVTGGSVSISKHYSILRLAGATARHMLVAAAAQTWEVEQEACLTEGGWVIHPDGDPRIAYGELVKTAATLPVPKRSEVSVKDSKDFRLIGTRMGHWDAPQIVDGSAVYGIDVLVPNMLYATIARSPVFGGKLVSFDAAKAKAVAGVRDVIEIGDGLAVIADSTWAAIQGRRALEDTIAWDEGQNAGLSSAGIRQALVERVSKPAEPGGSDVLEAAYDVPFLAHATMEPMNCLADVRHDRCEVWAPTQNPQDAKQRARTITGLPSDSIHVHVPLIGGGFGRRLAVDYVEQAVKISKAVGAPVKLMWTREDDIRHDLYHPLSYNYVRASLDDPGRFTVRSYKAQGVPTGYWRSVTNIPDALAHECFLDEMAVALDKDPYQLRLELLPERSRAVLELAATKADWGTPLPDGWGRGMAYHSTWDVTPVAQVAEVSVDEDGTVRVHRVVCVIDCGTVINPDTVEAQMEGGIVFGLTAVLRGAVTLENGRVQQSNFHDYALLRMDEMPKIEVHIVPSDRNPSGVGEMGVPPIIPATLNAIFAATGKRIRRLPVRPQDLRGG